MKRRLVSLTLMLSLGAASALAQSKTGTTVGQFLLVEPSARIAAMGNAGVTVAGEIEAAYYNPAAIGMLPGSGVQFTYSPWLADITYNYVGAALSLGDIGNLFASVTSLNSGEIDVRTVEQPLGTGERYRVSDLAFGLGFGRRMSDRFSLGVQATYMQENIWHSSMSAVAFNIGTLYQISEGGLRIGASVSNWGTRAEFDGRDLRIVYDMDATRNGDNRALPAALFADDFPLPVLFRVGLGLPLTIGESNRLFLAVDAFHPSDNTESVSFGAEWTVLNIFSLRAGYQNLFLQDSEVGLTLGAGLEYAVTDVHLFFDYAWADHGRLENTQRLTLGVLF
jgi:long-subunit fatty acid transport protein